MDNDEQEEVVNVQECTIGSTYAEVVAVVVLVIGVVRSLCIPIKRC